MWHRTDPSHSRPWGTHAGSCHSLPPLWGHARLPKPNLATNLILMMKTTKHAMIRGRCNLSGRVYNATPG